MPTLPVKSCRNGHGVYSLEDHPDGCPDCPVIPEGTKRWKVTVEVVMDSVPADSHGPLTLEDIRRLTENHLAEWAKAQRPWCQKFETKIQSLDEVKRG